MNVKLKRILTAVITLILLVTFLWLLQLLLMPKYMTDIKEGALIQEYYDNPEGHDVIFIGDCEVYENISPITLWREYGISSYIRGSAQQLIWQSYYILEDTYRYETPSVVVYNVQPMIYGEPQNEAYNRMTLDAMPLSSSKISAIRASMTDDESLISYIFPILRFHSRWSELSYEDVRYMFGRDSVSYGGYLMQTAVRPMESLPAVKPLDDYTLPDICFDYLGKMAALCKEHGSELVLVKSPSLYPHWYDEWDAQIVKYASENGLKYYNFLDVSSEIGIDMRTDTYDMGMHLNVYGAEKYSSYLGRILQEEIGITDRRGEAEYDAVWNDLCKRYDDAKSSGSASGEGSSQNKPENNTPGTETGNEHPHDGYYFTAAGVDIGVKCPPYLLDRIQENGTKYSYYEAVSCAYQGMDMFYTFDSFEVLVNTVDGTDMITAISILDDMVRIPEGLRIGDSLDDMIKALGDDYTRSGNIYTYVKDGTVLSILFRDNAVRSIEYTISAE